MPNDTVLSDENLSELERDVSLTQTATFPMTTEQVRALCATVRVLRGEREHWESPSDEGTCRFCGNLRDVPHGHIRKCYCIPMIKRYVEDVTDLQRQLRLEQTASTEFKRLSEDLVARLQSENTALREQLAHRTIELEREGREMQKWNNRANQLAIEGQDLRQERDRLRNALLPFALLDVRHLSERPDNEPIWAINKSQITNGHIRTAQRLLQAAVEAELQL